MEYRRFTGKCKLSFWHLHIKNLPVILKVYIFSRKSNLKYGYSTREMAKDQANAMKAIGISNAMIVGVSQGGMIAQYLAIDYPELVKKLVLAVTVSRKIEQWKKSFVTGLQ